MVYAPPILPLMVDLETKPVLKKLAQARSSLAELKGVAASMPNEGILINTLSLQEAKDSSAIENIITTHDDLYRSDALAQEFASLAAKEVHSYALAMREGFEGVRKTGLITNGDILKIQATLEQNEAGFRKLPGTALKNDQTGEIVYTPPQSHDEILGLMGNLEGYINTAEIDQIDPLIRMAVIHHQFETIHPFYDGNGRTGRILMILYLIKEGLLGTPVLYLSRYINQNKASYYRLLQAVRMEGAWEEWIIWLLNGIDETAVQTTRLINGIRTLMGAHKGRMRRDLPKIYSQDLLNNLFRHPYTKIDFVMNEIGVHRNTAVKYLDALAGVGLVEKMKIGRENYYLNKDLFDLLLGAGQRPE